MEKQKNGPTALIILDGLGLSENPTASGDAFYTANTPVIDDVLKSWPNSTLHASHSYVGLPDGQMGNSEVGHLNIGAGRIVLQELLHITKAIERAQFEENGEFLDFITAAKNIHLMGLLSDGGVHSHIDHLFGIIKIINKIEPDKKIFIHAFLDGRDTPPDSAYEYLKLLDEFIMNFKNVKLRSIVGRMYAMDRDSNWDRVKKGYDLLVYGKGERFASYSDGIKSSYANKIFDEFVEPIAIRDKTEDILDGTIQEDDGVFFFNFRADRAREITMALTFSDPKWADKFSRKNELETKISYLCMTSYHEKFGLPVVFKNETHNNLIGEVIAKNKLKQLRIAETEKYAHVTFFFNGGTDTPFLNEDRILVPSPKVQSYDLKPEMSAYEVTEELLKVLDEGLYDFIVLNYANPDMVGHTGKLPAAIKALEVVDECLGKILKKFLEIDANVFITSDHGNCEQMYEPGSKEPHTAHTTNKVFLVAFGNRLKNIKLKHGKLADIAPSILTLMGIDIPNEMTGEILFE